LLDGLQEMEDEAHVKNQINQVIAKLQRKKKNIDSKTMEHFIDMSGGMDPTQFVVDIQSREPEDAKKRLLTYYDLFRMLQESKTNGGKPVVISSEEDVIIEDKRGYGSKDARPEDYLDEFSNYVQNNINEIAALKIICTRPRDLTRESLKSLMLTLDREGYTVQQLNTAISQLTNEEMAADIISLIRRYAIGSVLISHEARIHKAIDRLRKAHKFTMQEQNWIKRMEDYLMNESVLNVRVFDEDSRFISQGGFAKINKVFGNKLESVVLELNEYLYDDGGRTA
jgi:type I restriction enzyme R subunit